MYIALNLLRNSSIVFEEFSASISNFSVTNIRFTDFPQHRQYTCICQRQIPS